MSEQMLTRKPRFRALRHEHRSYGLNCDKSYYITGNPCAYDANYGWWFLLRKAILINMMLTTKMTKMTMMMTTTMTILV